MSQMKMSGASQQTEMRMPKSVLHIKIGTNTPMGHDTFVMATKSMIRAVKAKRMIGNSMATKATPPHIYGYALAWTWAGVIEFNKELFDAIAEATEKLKAYFPNETPQIIIRGQQR